VSTSQYPDLIQNLPQANLPVAGVIGYLFQGKEGQICFFDFEGGTEVPAHSHGAQWGIIIEGELSMTIGDKTQIMRRGDSYYVPAGVVHSAVIDKPCKVMDFFEDNDRYDTTPTAA